jgi:hypothetical protein
MFLWMIIEEPLTPKSKLIARDVSVGQQTGFLKGMEFRITGGVSCSHLSPNGKYTAGEILYDLENIDQKFISLSLRRTEAEIRDAFEVIN